MRIAGNLLRLTFFCFWGLFLTFSFSPAYAQDIRIEGIMVDTANPENSVVIINGEFLKKGDLVKRYRVLEVQAGSVAFLDEESGSKEWLSVEAVIPETAESPLETESEVLEPSNTSDEPKGLKEKFQELLELPKKFINRIWELMALRDLAILNNASVLYYNQTGRFPAMISQIVSANLIAPSYEEGKRGKYQLYLISPPNPQQFAVRADPVDPTSGLRFFYIGTDTIIRESTGKQATARSAPHDYSSL